MLPDQLANSGWTADKWDELEAHARETVNRHAGLRHVIPRGPDMPGAYVVNVITKEDNEALQLRVKEATPPTRIEISFNLLPEQIGDFDMALRLVERAARSLAVEEDRKIYFEEGLLGSARLKRANATPDACVAAGRNELNSGGGIPYRGPYCLAAEPRFWDTMMLPEGANDRGFLPNIEAILGADARILSVVKGKQEEDARGRAVLFSIDRFAMELVFVEPPTISVAGFDKTGLKLLLEERLKLRIIDGNAICKLTLT